MNQQQQAQAAMIEICRNIVENFADKYNVDHLNLSIRIDMENTGALPVFGLFDKTGGAFRFLARHTLQEIISIGAADIPAMFRKMMLPQVRDIISDMFRQAMKGYESNDSKQLFVLLYLEKVQGDTMPAISIYLNDKKMDSALIGEPKQGTNGNT